MREQEVFPLALDVSNDGECIVYGYEDDIGVVITGYVFLEPAGVSKENQ